MKYNLIYIFLFLFSTSGFAQKIDTDHAHFFEIDSSLSWEFYYSISNDQLKYDHVSEDKFKAELECNLSILNGQDTLRSDFWSITDVRSVKDSVIRDLIGQKNYKMKAGNYKIYFSYKKYDGSVTTDKISLKLALNNNNVELGVLQLARSVQKSDIASPFSKYGFYVIPNPECVYATNQMDLYICHSYKVIKDPDDDDQYSLRYKILDAAKMPVIKEMDTLTIDKDNIYFKYYNTSLNGLPSGVYYAQVEIYKGIYLFETKEKKFYIYNYELPLETTLVFNEDVLFEMSEFSTMTDKQVDIALEMAKVVSHDTDKELFARLTTVKGKQRALYRFWQLRDRDTSTRVNETLMDFNTRVKYANKHFSTNQSKDNGWKTGRGIVLMRYGFPDDKDIHSVSMETRAWEEWHYTRFEGGAFFYFVERLGYNDFDLVHSTVTGEVYNPDWYNQYVPTEGDNRTPIELDNGTYNK